MAVKDFHKNEYKTLQQSASCDCGVCGSPSYVLFQDNISFILLSLHPLREIPSCSLPQAMELDIYFEKTHFDEQVQSTVTNQVLSKTATKHNTYAYNQCPKCLVASQTPLPGPLKPTHPMPHPSKCKDCRTLLKAELDALEQQMRFFKVNLDFLEEVPFTPIGQGKATVTDLSFLIERRKVLREQLREPCSYSIPLQGYMVIKQEPYRALQVERLDPRCSPHQHQGTICNFGGKIGSAQWEAANLVLRRGSTVMPGLVQQKELVKLMYYQEKELEKQKQKQRERQRERERERNGG
ncbi:MAG: hypothetical protein Q9209_005382 [Squamulea sp. 1 TL-2023]